MRFSQGLKTLLAIFVPELYLELKLDIFSQVDDSPGRIIDYFRLGISLNSWFIERRPTVMGLCMAGLD